MLNILVRERGLDSNSQRAQLKPRANMADGSVAECNNAKDQKMETSLARAKELQQYAEDPQTMCLLQQRRVLLVK